MEQKETSPQTPDYCEGFVDGYEQGYKEGILTLVSNIPEVTATYASKLLNKLPKIIMGNK